MRRGREGREDGFLPPFLSLLSKKGGERERVDKDHNYSNHLDYSNKTF